MKTSANYSISKIYDGDKTFIIWGISSSNTSTPTTWTYSEPNPQSNVFIWRKEGHGLDEASACWGNPICITGNKGDKGNTGDPGPEGETGKLSIEFSNNTITVKPLQNIGFIKANGMIINILTTNKNLTSNGEGLISCNYNNPSNCIISFGRIAIDTDNNLLQFVDYNTNSLIFYINENSLSERNIFIGKFYVNNNIIINAEVLNPINVYDYAGEKLIKIISNNSTNPTELEQWAKALKIDSFIENLAAANFFVNRLFANKIKLTSNGAIYSNYFTDNGTVNASSNADHGVYIGSDGLVKMWQAYLSGITLDNGSFISNEFSTQKSGGNNVNISETISTSSYDIGYSSNFFQEIENKKVELITSGLSGSIHGEYKGVPFTSVYYEGLGKSSMRFITLEDGVLHLGEVNLFEDYRTGNLLYDTVKSTDSCFATYNTWNTSSIVMEGRQANSLIATLKGLIPNNTACNFTGSYTIDKIGTSNDFSGENGKVIVGNSSVSFFNTNNVLVGAFTDYDILQDGTSIVLAVDAILAGITTMHITPFSNEDYDVGQSDKKFKNGYFGSVYSNNLYSDNLYIGNNRIDGIITKTSSGTEWYIKFSNGFTIRGGYVSGSSGLRTISLSPPMETSSYTVMTTVTNVSSDVSYSFPTSNLNASYFKVYQSQGRAFRWLVMGF
ncbi:MAG: hypothetical protein EOL97_06720 [Spirochaetia bacterium]|nr:hypothetical protein [Spirochaetia bacterium]